MVMSRQINEGLYDTTTWSLCGLSKLHQHDTQTIKLYDYNLPITSYLRRIGLKSGERKTSRLIFRVKVI